MALTTITTFTENADFWDPSLLPGLTDGVLADALGGNDTVLGTNFGDEISGEDGNDSLAGNQGDDTLDGGAGADTVYGGQGNDLIVSSAGLDWISANQGNDSITVTHDNTTVYGGQGDDTIKVDSKGNFISANRGSDVITVTGDDNEVYGGKDNDVINVESSTSKLISANDGDDIITINGGNHLVYGGKNNDTFLIKGSGEITVYGDLGDNKFELDAGVATAALKLFGGQNPEILPSGQTPEGVATLEILGNNDLLNTTLGSIPTLEINSGVAAIISASQITTAGITNITGSGGLTVTGTPDELLALQPLLTNAAAGGVTVSTQTGDTTRVGISRTKYGLGSGVTEFFVIDGAQFAPLIPPASPDALRNSLGALAIQFGVLPPSTTLPLTPAQYDAVIEFGEKLNKVEYIPQVTLEQKDELLNEFYALVDAAGFETIENRFLSVIDTKGTSVTTDDSTTLYFSPTGQFGDASTNLQTVGVYADAGFAPSNPAIPPTVLNLDTIPASTEFVLI